MMAALRTFGKDFPHLCGNDDELRQLLGKDGGLQDGWPALHRSRQCDDVGRIPPVQPKQSALAPADLDVTDGVWHNLIKFVIVGIYLFLYIRCTGISHLSFFRQTFVQSLPENLPN